MGHKKLTVGRHTYGEKNITIKSNIKKLKVTVGNFCSIANNCLILLGVEHDMDVISTFPFDHFNWGIRKGKIHPITKGDVRIGHDVWLGENTTILSGVTIGNGVVIGAQAVVSKNVPSYSVVVGNPAKVVKYRFTETQIEELLKIAWWNWTNEKIRENIQYFTKKNIDEFIEKFRQ